MNRTTSNTNVAVTAAAVGADAVVCAEDCAEGGTVTSGGIGD